FEPDRPAAAWDVRENSVTLAPPTGWPIVSTTRPDQTARAGGASGVGALPREGLAEDGTGAVSALGVGALAVGALATAWTDAGDASSAPGGAPGIVGALSPAATAGGLGSASSSERRNARPTAVSPAATAA